jgi:hypothetical protein
LERGFFRGGHDLSKNIRPSDVEFTTARNQRLVITK